MFNLQFMSVREGIKQASEPRVYLFWSEHENNLPGYRRSGISEDRSLQLAA